LLEEGECGGTRLIGRDRRRFDEGQQPRARVHFPHEVVHPGQSLSLVVDDEVGPYGDDLEVVVGDQCCDLDDHVAVGVEPGHLEVHPRQHLRMVSVAKVSPCTTSHCFFSIPIYRCPPMPALVTPVPTSSPATMYCCPAAAAARSSRPARRSRYPRATRASSSLAVDWR